MSKDISSEEKLETNTWGHKSAYLDQDGQQVLMARVGTLDDLFLDSLSPLFQTCDQEEEMNEVPSTSFQSIIIGSHEEMSHPFPFASFGILNNCKKDMADGAAKGTKKLDPKTSDSTTCQSTLRTNRIIEMAASLFIQSNFRNSQLELSSASGDPNEHSYPFPFSDDDEDDDGVQLLLDLLSCAENLRTHAYDTASRVLEDCRRKLTTSSYNEKDSIHRLVYHFTEALGQKIEREMGRFTDLDDEFKKWCLDSGTPSSSIIAVYSKSPVMHITAFTSVQIILDHVKGCRKVHVIELGFRCGNQQAILMEALVGRTECRIDHLKITAVTTAFSKKIVEEVGGLLKTMAGSLNLKFSFRVILIDDIIDLLLNIDVKEAAVVRASFVLDGLILKQHQLETLMRVIRRIRPRVMVVSESEANINSPVFVNRFVEALFFFGANFDWIEESLKDDPTVRAFAECQLYGPEIRNIVGTEGEERKHRIVGIKVWRAFFARFGMIETQLSALSLQHAALVPTRFQCGKSCTLDIDGKALIVGWKGSPIYSISAWNFIRMPSIPT